MLSNWGGGGGRITYWGAQTEKIPVLFVPDFLWFPVGDLNCVEA